MSDGRPIGIPAGCSSRPSSAGRHSSQIGGPSRPQPGHRAGNARSRTRPGTVRMTTRGSSRSPLRCQFTVQSITRGEGSPVTMRGMTNERAGRLIAAVRIHLGLRQIDVARMAGVDQKVVSFLERGLFERVSITRIRRVCAALGIDFTVDLRYRGALGDRLLDRGHAALVERVVTELQTLGWIVRPEFTFNV